VIKVKLTKQVEVLQRQDLGLESFPSTVNSSLNNWSDMLNEAYSLGYIYGGIINQQVGGDKLMYVVFNKLPSKSVKKPAQ